MVLRYQLLGNRWICDARTDFLGDELADEVVGRLIDKDVAEVRKPDAEAGLTVQPLPHRLALVGANFQRLAPVRVVQETVGGLVAQPENVLVGGLDVRLLRSADRAIVQRCTPVGRALEHAQGVPQSSPPS